MLTDQAINDILTSFSFILHGFLFGYLISEVLFGSFVNWVSILSIFIFLIIKNMLKY